MATSGRKPNPPDDPAGANDADGCDVVCPATVDAYPGARIIWDRTLADIGVRRFRPVDEPLLASYCVAVANAAAATEALAQSGLVVQGPGGEPVASPYLRIFSQQTEAARRLASELRITPAERARRAA